MCGQKMRFAAFIAPFHPVGENPTLALDLDIELVRWMDKLGYDEAWVGEHQAVDSRAAQHVEKKGTKNILPAAQ